MSKELQKIVINTIGTRGDIQPFMALALAFTKAGYEAHVLTNSNHVVLLEESGVNCTGVFCDFEREMQERPELASSMANGDMGIFMQGFSKLSADHAKPHLKAWHEAMKKIKPDLFITGTLSTIFGIIAERKMGIPQVTVKLNSMPEAPEKMIFGLPNSPEGKSGNRKAVRDIVISSLDGTKRAYDGPCKELLGYKPFDYWTLEDSFAELFNPRYCCLIGQSPTLGKFLWPDAPKGIKYCGQFAMTTEAQVQVAEQTQTTDLAVTKKKSGMYGTRETITAIEDFIKAGPKPVYMGWGSMTAKSPEYMVELVARAVKHAGSRALVFRGWASLSIEVLKKATDDTALIEYSEKNLFFVGKTAHDWLFPQCSCIVHHGGSGTMSTAARSGAPQIITPVFLDQWDHAMVLNELGTGYGFETTQLTKLSAAELGEAIKKCEGTPAMQEKAEEWARTMRAENGPQRALEHIQWFWESCVQTGDYDAHIKRRLQEIRKSRKASGICCFAAICG